MVRSFQTRVRKIPSLQELSLQRWDRIAQGHVAFRTGVTQGWKLAPSSGSVSATAVASIRQQLKQETGRHRKKSEVFKKEKDRPRKKSEVSEASTPLCVGRGGAEGSSSESASKPGSDTRPGSQSSVGESDSIEYSIQPSISVGCISDQVSEDGYSLEQAENEAGLGASNSVGTASDGAPESPPGSGRLRDASAQSQGYSAPASPLLVAEAASHETIHQPSQLDTDAATACATNAMFSQSAFPTGSGGMAARALREDPEISPRNAASEADGVSESAGTGGVLRDPALVPLSALQQTWPASSSMMQHLEEPVSR